MDISKFIIQHHNIIEQTLKHFFYINFSIHGLIQSMENFIELFKLKRAYVCVGEIDVFDYYNQFKSIRRGIFAYIPFEYRPRRITH